MAAGFVVESERQAFERFRNDLAPSGWVIAHNLYFSARRENRGISGNELDLLLVHRDHGIVIVEVKGGKSYDRVRDGTWHQDGVPMNRGPEQQANSYRSKLRNLFASHPQWQTADLGEPPIGIMLCFPRADLDPIAETRLAAAASLSADQIIDRRALARDGAVLERVSLLATRMQANADRFDPGFDWVDTALSIISPALEFSTSLIGDLDVNRARLEADERTHRDWVENLGGLPRLHFEGGAGAGKSIVARLRARALADSGARVLFVCSTAGLAKSFQGEVARRGEDRIVANTLHQALVLQARGTNAPERFGIPASGPLPTELLPTLPGMAADIARNSTERFDALIIDEAQDFGGNVTRDMTGFLSDPDGGSVWTFGDHYQRLGPDWADGAAGDPAANGAHQIVMRQNHRSPRPVFDLAEGLRRDGVERVSRHKGIGHQRVDYRECTNGDQRPVLDQVLTELANQRIPPARIAVVTMQKTDGNPLFANRRVGKWGMEMANPQLDANGKRRPLAAEDLPEPDADKVYFDSVRRMKGLERGVIVLVDVPDPGPPGSLERRLLYMGVSRATTYLAIIATPARVARLKEIASGLA